MTSKKQKVNPITEATDALAAVEREIEQHRATIADANVRLRIERKNCAEAISEWVRSSQRVDSGAQFRADALAERREIAAGRAPSPKNPRPADSVIDRTAMAMSGASRSGARGGGSAFRRGATTVRGLRMPTKLPSNR